MSQSDAEMSRVEEIAALSENFDLRRDHLRSASHLEEAHPVSAIVDAGSDSIIVKRSRHDSLSVFLATQAQASHRS
jgi:hypothetical protein